MRICATKFVRQTYRPLVHGLFPALLLVAFLCAPANLRAATPEAPTAAEDRETVSRPIPPEVIAERHRAVERAESAVALFMIGLITGMLVGIGLFFLYVRRQENRYARHKATEYLFEDWPNRPSPGLRSPTTNDHSPNSAAGRENAGTVFETDDPNDEMIEQREPWERCVDWWKGEPEE